jgi:CRISPR-associated endoribonuclease Cas6
MRIHLKLTKNEELIPYNYQSFLTGALHKWMGKENLEHGNVSLYSFSWLQNVDTTKEGINLKRDSIFFISGYDELLIKTIVKGIMVDPSVCFGSSVSAIHVEETPVFSTVQRFSNASPVFVRRFEDDKNNHLSFNDEKAPVILTEIMQRKLSLAGLPTDNVQVSFDRTYPNPCTKVITYKGIGNRVNLCPVIVEGTPEQVAFAWDVGVGHSTGIGFGALKRAT